MLLDIARRLPTRRIASRHLLALALIPPHIIDPHDGRKPQPFPIDPRPRIADPKVKHDAHRLLAHNPLPHIPIRPDGPSIHEQIHLIPNEPRDLRAFARARRVLERVLLVLRVVVPRAVERRRARNGLLVGGAAVAVHGRDVVVADGEVVVVGPPEDVEGGDLVGLGDDAKVRVAVGAGFDDVDFGRAAAAAGRRVVGAGAGAGGAALAGQLAEPGGVGLVGRDARVARVVGVGPRAVGGGLVARAAEVAHGPGAGPQALHAAGPGKRDADFQRAAFEAGLVPALQHAAAVVEAVVGEVVEAEVERAVGRGGGVRVVPF